MAAPVYLLGSGLVTCLGEGLHAQVAALAACTPGAARQPQGLNIPPWPYHLAGDALRADWIYEMIARAVMPALAQARLEAGAQRRLAIFVGSTCIDLPLHESRYAESLRRGEADVPMLGPSFGNIAAHIARQFGIEGAQYTLNTACSSSANALLHAHWMLREGSIDHALVVGVEAYNRLSVQGFGSLLLLSRQGYKPFDRARDGLILGEGVGAMLLGRDPPAGVAAPLKLCGGASACDPSSPTNSSPERIAEVMRAALADAQVDVGALCAIKAHGTGTASNDASEGLGMRAVSDVLPPFTSLKPYTGHTLGGCGTIETLCLLAAWEQGFLPATPGFGAPDPEIGIAPITASHPLPPRGAVLCNFFGFGGNNTSLVVAR